MDEVGVAMEHRELVSDWLLPVARQVTDSAVALFPWNADSGADPDGDLIFEAKVSCTRDPPVAFWSSPSHAWRCRHSNTSRY